jgi:serine/threonine protein kinase
MQRPQYATDDLTGRVLADQFRLEALLGRGGMGDVYVAEQLGIGRRVVIKLLSSPGFSNADVEQRFKHEALALAQLNHPNVVHLYMFGRTDDGIAFLAMELIDGRTLASLLDERGALPELEVLGILDQLCSALVEAHAHGVVHRDLKPENVMLVERHDQAALVKVLDFGIAKLTHTPDLRMTRDGEVLGTPLYMAPEQIAGGEVDERTDIYAFGLIAYELLTGEVPFEAETTMALLARAVNEQAIPPSRKVPGLQISAVLDALIARCLAKDPAYRFHSAIALREALASARAAYTRGEVETTDDESLSLVVFHATDPIRLRSAKARALRGRLRSLVLALSVGAAISYAIVTFLPQQHRRAAVEAGSFPVREWIQGIPFPEGTDYDRFEPLVIEARMPLRVERTMAFYRHYLATKWGGFRELDGGLVFDDPRAPVKELTVAPFRDASRLTILRRPPLQK